MTAPRVGMSSSLVAPGGCVGYPPAVCGSCHPSVAVPAPSAAERWDPVRGCFVPAAAPATPLSLHGRCPACGRCRCCGSRPGGFRADPWWPTYPVPQLWWAPGLPEIYCETTTPGVVVSTTTAPRR